MPLAATIPASCLQYHNPSWSLSLSESPGVFIFPLERELSSQPGQGRRCHPPCDGRLFVATRSPGPFSPQHKPAPKHTQSDKQEGLAGKWSLRQVCPGLLNLPEYSQPPPPRSKRQTNTVPALIELLGYLSSAGSPMAEHLGALFPGDLTSGKSTRLRKVGMPRSPQGADLSPSSKPPCCSPRLPS